MRLTLAQMEAVYWTSRLGSTTAAADQLGLTQPSVTLRLQEFRRATGTDPFQRTAAGLRLTEAGRRLLGQITAVLDLARAISGQGSSEPEGTFRLGFAEGFAVIHLPRLLPALRARFPRLRPELTVSTSRELEEMLTQAQLDAAVVSDPVGAGLRSIPLGAQRITWVVSPQWDMPASVTPKMLENVPIMVNSPGSPMHRRMSRWFNTAAIQPSNVGYCSSGAAILHLVAAGLAASLAPVSLVLAHQTPTLRMLEAAPAVASGSLFVCERAGSTSPAAHAIAEIIEQLLGRDPPECDTSSN